MNSDVMTNCRLLVGETVVFDELVDAEPFPLYEAGKQMWSEIKHRPIEQWRLEVAADEGDEPITPGVIVTSDDSPVMDAVSMVGILIEAYCELWKEGGCE